jgi:transposase
MLDRGGLPLDLTLLSAGTQVALYVIRRSGGRPPCALTAGGSDLVGAWLEAPSLSCPNASECVPTLLIASERTGMSTIASPQRLVTGGVDTHVDVHVAAACDHLGGLLATASFPTTASGYRKLLSWLRSFGTRERVGVEGTGSYGAGLARYLRAQDVAVIEVSRPNRQARRTAGKTDVIDAIAAARAVISGQAAATPKTHDGAVEALRTLRIVHNSARKARTQAINQLRALLVTAPDELRASLRRLPRRQLLATCAAFRPGDADDLTSITKLALRELAVRVGDLDAQIARLRVRRDRIVKATAPAMLAPHGAGPDTVTAVLLAAGDNPDRLNNDRSFAALLGVSPIQASSGKTHRHRLNRGDRQGNSALWRIVICRMNSDPRTQAYVERRTKEGLSKPEIIRCLKRYVARELFNALPREALS